MTTRRRWGRAGIRLTPKEAEARDQAARARREQRDAAHRAMLTRAHRRWAAGLVVPARITMVLDAAGLHGPEVDRACLAAEPAVDRWEAGTLYPTFAQLCALAELTATTPELLCDQGTRPATFETTLRFHVLDRAVLERPHVLRFTDTALAEAAVFGVRR